MVNPIGVNLIDIGLINLTYNGSSESLSDHDIEDRLLDTLLGKSLEFTTKGGTQAAIEFHGIGLGKPDPCTIVNLQVSGVKFIKHERRLSYDIRYIFYKRCGESLLFRGSASKFLASSPTVQKLGEKNVLISFAVYGDTISQVNRSLSLFAEVVGFYESELHQVAIDRYMDFDGKKVPNISLDAPISENTRIESSLHHLQATKWDESYIEEYIEYMIDEDFRETVDNRNTFAKKEFE